MQCCNMHAITSVALPQSPLDRLLVCQRVNASSQLPALLDNRQLGGSLRFAPVFQSVGPFMEEGYWERCCG
jgi:hypothetical protein